MAKYNGVFTDAVPQKIESVGRQISFYKDDVFEFPDDSIEIVSPTPASEVGEKNIIPPTAKEYSDAIDILTIAATQLQPDGRNCVICEDIDHQAFECNKNPLVLAKRAIPRWRCFHCNAIFDTAESARKHFGNIPDAVPMCILKDCLCSECPCNPIKCRGRGELPKPITEKQGKDADTAKDDLTNLYKRLNQIEQIIKDVVNRLWSMSPCVEELQKIQNQINDIELTKLEKGGGR